MQCIFCKESSDNSVKIEHIIPESLGNKNHVLPPGVVCDSCNQYFGSKVEKEVLEQSFFRNLRFRQYVVNKKGKPPVGKSIIIDPLLHDAEIREVNGSLEVIIHNEKVFNDLHEQMSNGTEGKLIIPSQDTPPLSDDVYISRFLGKIAIELLASKLMKLDSWQTDFINHQDIDRMRHYARYGKGKYWPYHYRQIHNENEVVVDESKKYQKVHEMNIISFNKNEFYLILSFFGHEFAINIGDRSLDSYFEWLQKNNNISPLSFKQFKINYDY